MTSTVAALVLAGGRGRRFGADARTSKAAAPLRGIPLVRSVATTALASRASLVTVVSGHAGDTVTAALEGLDVAVVTNSDFASGMASSLKAGLAAMPATIDGVLVMLADMPAVQVATLDLLIMHFDGHEAPIHGVAPVYKGRRGNPVLIGRRLFPAMQSLTGDEGARMLLKRPDVVVAFCPVPDPGVTIDIDTPAELERLERSW